MVGRRGGGKRRHVRVFGFWLQEKAEPGKLTYKSSKGTETPVDLMTKALSCVEIIKHMAKIGIEGREGRAAMSL